MSVDASLPDPGPPPRQVPTPVQISLLFGGLLNLFGWLFLLVGLVFVSIFAVQADGWSLWLAGAETDLVDGTVTAANGTGWREGGKGKRAVPVKRFAFEFADSTGTRRSGISFAARLDVRPGQPVKVEVPRERPERACIAGMRRAVLPSAALLVLLAPLVAAGLTLAGLRGGRRACRLLAFGHATTCVLVEKAPTRSRINNRPVLRLIFEFDARDGRRRRVAALTHRPELLESEGRGLVFYDPWAADNAVVLQGLPGHPQWAADRSFRLGSPAHPWQVAILPVLNLLGYGTLALYLKLA
ncbi:MAG: DUF3592 domain-containing protein [Candidatus Riflebacteria bacterium]|nr:DUF3592 domain-containing protein [Candidatus Riflebacteria bacterium]